MSYFVSKIGHLDPRFYSLIYCAIPGVQMSGVQMSDFISKIGHLESGPPLLQCYILCNTGGPDVGGPDVGGPYVGGPDVGGPDVPHSFYVPVLIHYVIILLLSLLLYQSRHSLPGTLLHFFLFHEENTTMRKSCIISYLWLKSL